MTYLKQAILLKNIALVAQLDSSKDPRLLDQFGVSTFPTLKLFNKGKEIAQYPKHSPRTTESIVFFVNNHGNKMPLKTASAIHARFEPPIGKLIELSETTGSDC